MPRHSHPVHRPSYRPSPRPEGCALRLPGDARCSGPERIGVTTGAGQTRRGCLEHAAQTLVRLHGATATSGDPADLHDLEARMRACRTWHAAMRKRRQR